MADFSLVKDVPSFGDRLGKPVSRLHPSGWHVYNNPRTSMLSPIPHFFGLRYRTLVEIIVGGTLAMSFLVYWTVRIVEATFLTSKHDCPACHSNDVSLSMRKRVLDWPFRLFGCVPCRCHVCSTRYFCARVEQTRRSNSREFS
jgi:hypothetical protein